MPRVLNMPVLQSVPQETAHHISRVFNMLGLEYIGYEYVVRCAIWYYFYNVKNVKNTHGRMLILVKLQAEAATLLKLTLFHGCFSSFLNCTNATKSHNAPHMSMFHRVLRKLYFKDSSYLCR